MFQSRVRAINIPQLEHQRLAGTLAQLWGNDAFERPALPFDSFVKGVWFHDRDYPPHDNYPIGSLDEEAWVAIKQNTVELRYADVVADLVAMFHARRLLSNGTGPSRGPMMDRADAVIETLLQQADYPRAAFERADRITALCDAIAFDFCFETPTESRREVFARPTDAEPTAVTYRIQSGGVISVEPWPFGVESHRGTIVGYVREGYPHHLEPVLVDFALRREQ